MASMVFGWNRSSPSYYNSNFTTADYLALFILTSLFAQSKIKSLAEQTHSPPIYKAIAVISCLPYLRSLALEPQNPLPWGEKIRAPRRCTLFRTLGVHLSYAQEGIEIKRDQFYITQKLIPAESLKATATFGISNKRSDACRIIGTNDNLLEQNLK